MCLAIDGDSQSSEPISNALGCYLHCLFLGTHWALMTRLQTCFESSPVSWNPRTNVPGTGCRRCDGEGYECMVRAEAREQKTVGQDYRDAPCGRKREPAFELSKVGVRAISIEEHYPFYVVPSICDTTKPASMDEG